MLHEKGKFSQFSSSGGEENDVGRRKSPLKIWQVLLKVAVLILPQCFFPYARMEGTELFQIFYSLSQRSRINYKISFDILAVEG